MTVLEEQMKEHKRNSHTNKCSTCGGFEQDILNFIKEAIPKTPHKYFIVTITKRPPKGTLGGDIRWHIDGTNSVMDLHRKDKKLNDDNIIFYHVHNSSIHKIDKRSLK